jgi:hypothetical protein
MAQLVVFGSAGDSYPIGIPDACEEALITHLYKSHYGLVAVFGGTLLGLAAGSMTPLDLPIFTSLHPSLTC